MQVITIHDDELGKDFTINVYGSVVVENLKQLKQSNEEGWEDHPPVDSVCDYTGYKVTQEDRDADVKRIDELIAIFENIEETERYIRVQAFPFQPRKKNHTFAKSRVINTEMFETFSVYWEDSYGANTPALRMRATGDYTATFSYEEFVVKY